MLDESGQRHSERLGQLADRALPSPKRRQHRTTRGVGKRPEDSIQPVCRIVNHTVQFKPV